MKLSTKTRYGTRALVDLALRGESDPASAREIAEEQELSPKYLGALLAIMRSAGLVRSARGSQGGHVLARPPDQITLRQVYEALEGSDGFVYCTGDPAACARADTCTPREVWDEMYDAAMHVLESITLADLARRARAKRRPSASKSSASEHAPSEDVTDRMSWPTKKDKVGMDDYMKTGVKALIDQYPEVGEILERFGVGCVPCAIGTCQLVDVLSIHALEPQDQTELLSQIGRVISPEGKVSLTRELPDTGPPRPAEITYSPPLQRLVDEHVWIKRLLALIPDLVSEIRGSADLDEALLLQTVDFIRSYADRFHHMKEEDILFDYTDREAEIVRVILEDHERARGFVSAIVRAIEDGDRGPLWANLFSYRELLTEHIAKEDEVLFPYIDRGLSTSQVGEIFGRFQEAESALAEDVPHRYTQFITSLAIRFERAVAIP